MKTTATFDLEQLPWKKNLVVIGIDEVGRGALAGPLTVGAVCFKPAWMDNSWKKLTNRGINDSKLLSSKKREVMAEFIKKNSLAYATASCNVDEINSKGITAVLSSIFNDVVQKIIILLPSDFKV